MRSTGALLRDWDGGDLLDITGDTFIGCKEFRSQRTSRCACKLIALLSAGQDDVATFDSDVVLCLTGCLYDARVMAIDRLVSAFTQMGEKSGRPK